jgi:ribonuclease HI
LDKKNNKSNNLEITPYDKGMTYQMFNTNFDIPNTIQKKLTTKLKINKNIKLFVDGGCSGEERLVNSIFIQGVIGGSSYVNNEVLFKFSGNIGYPCTNNTAEYFALIIGLSMLSNLNLSADYKLLINADSELMCNQVNSDYKVLTPHIKILHDVAMKLFLKIPNVKIKHIYREFNTEADALGELGKKITKNKLHLFI